jgi:hypothetical protein
VRLNSFRRQALPAIALGHIIIGTVMVCSTNVTTNPLVKTFVGIERNNRRAPSYRLPSEYSSLGIPHLLILLAEGFNPVVLRFLVQLFQRR